MKQHVLAGLVVLILTLILSGCSRTPEIEPPEHTIVLADSFEELRGIAVPAKGEVVVADTGRGEVVILDPQRQDPPASRSGSPERSGGGRGCGGRHLGGERFAQ